MILQHTVYAYMNFKACLLKRRASSVIPSPKEATLRKSYKLIDKNTGKEKKKTKMFKQSLRMSI